MDQQTKWLCNVPEHQFEQFRRARIGGRTNVVKGDPKPTGTESLEEIKAKGWVGAYEVVQEGGSPGLRPGEQMTMEGAQPT